MEKNIVKLELKPVGKNGLFEIRKQLEKFVYDNFELLYEGAIRLGCAIEKDYWAPRRIQINDTRLHEHIGIKYADGHKYNDPAAPTEKQLRNTVADIQQLIDAASENIPKPFTLIIHENQLPSV